MLKKPWLYKCEGAIFITFCLFCNSDPEEKGILKWQAILLIQCNSDLHVVSYSNGNSGSLHKSFAQLVIQAAEKLPCQQGTLHLPELMPEVVAQREPLRQMFCCHAASLKRVKL